MPHFQSSGMPNSPTDHSRREAVPLQEQVIEIYDIIQKHEVTSHKCGKGGVKS